MKIIKLFSMAMLCLSVSLVSCSGEDGKDGIDGIDGVNGKDGANGQDGADGANGQDGADGLGFDELAQYGYITLEMEGTRADNVAFQDSTSFRFTPVQGGYLSEFSYLSTYTVLDNLVHSFTVGRFLSSPDDIYQEAVMLIFMEVTNLGEEGQEVYFSYTLENYAVVGDDNKYFTLNHSYSTLSPEILDFQISDLAYDADTHHLTFSYAFTLDGAGNVTGNPINMSGMVDAIVLEEIDQ